MGSQRRGRTGPAPQIRLERGIPRELLPHLRPLLTPARNLGLGVSGTRGIGKSQLLRIITWLDFVAHETPTIVLDPIGAVIDGLLGHICYFHPEDQARLWARIRYVNLSPPDYVVPTPLYYRTGLGRETTFEVSQRLPDAIARLDPKLKDASVLGFNALWELATHAGRILVALGYQASELEPLLRDPAAWLRRMEQANATCPEVAESVAFFRDDFLSLTPAERKRRANSLLTKLTILADPITRAQFCAATPGIDWTAVMEDKLLVLFDLRHEHSWETRQFKMLWLFLAIVDFIKRWGAAHSGKRSHPLSLIVDEITFMFSQGSMQKNLLVGDLDGLINRLSRNYNVWFTASFQEPYQLPAGMRQTLLSLGTQFFGRMTDPESMRLIADRVTVYDPYAVKKVEPIYATTWGVSSVIDERTREFSLAEQRELTRQRFAKLPKYHYLISRTVREGEAPQPLESFSIAPFAARRFPDPILLSDIRTKLSQRDGRPVGAVLEEIAARQQGPTPDAAEGSQMGLRPTERASVRLEDGLPPSDDPAIPRSLLPDSTAVRGSSLGPRLRRKARAGSAPIPPAPGGAGGQRV